jgi:hypothetical protein
MQTSIEYQELVEAYARGVQVLFSLIGAAEIVKSYGS